MVLHSMKYVAIAALAALPACTAPREGPPDSRAIAGALGNPPAIFRLDGAAVERFNVTPAEQSAVRDVRVETCKAAADKGVYHCSFSLVLYDPARGAESGGLRAGGEGDFRAVAANAWKGLQEEYRLTIRARTEVAPAG